MYQTFSRVRASIIEDASDLVLIWMVTQRRPLSVDQQVKNGAPVVDGHRGLGSHLVVAIDDR